MKTQLASIAVCLTALTALPALAQEELYIEAFESNGQLVFDRVTNAESYRVEWAPTLDGPWTNFMEASSLLDVIPGEGSGLITASVPMVYRVVATVTVPDFYAVNLDTAAYIINGQTNPTLELVRGETYTIDINASVHPFWIKTAATTGIDNIYTNGVINNGTYAGQITFTVPLDAPDTLYYICQFHEPMQGVINIVGGGGGESTYLVIDLSGGTNATSYPVSYLDDVPPGGWSNEHKTTKLVLRRIPAGTFTMGSPSGELGRVSNETEHEVTISQPFYMGVFEVTQKQWERVMGNYPSWFTNVTYRDSRPVEKVSYNMIRGTSSGTNWPASSAVDADSFMGKLQARTGKAFDLPTESQWEYAGRAGTTTALNSGQNLTNATADANLDVLGRYFNNHPGDFSPGSSVDTNGGTATVGSYQANAWGLFDIHGNVLEWCLDWYVSDLGTSALTDPLGASSGSDRVNRGGSWYHDADGCRVADRNRSTPDFVYDTLGLRVVLPPGQ